MGVFDIFRSAKPEVTPKEETGNFSVYKTGTVVGDDLRIFENKSYNIYNFGTKNDYPSKLINLYNTSPTNQAVINRTALMIAGNLDLEINNKEDLFSVVHAYSLLKHANSKETLSNVINKVALDFKLHGRLAIEVIYNEDHSKIVQLKRVDVSGIRIGILEEGEVPKYYYSENWLDNRCEKIEYTPFNKYNKEDNRQLIYLQLLRSGNTIYGLPDYYASLDWIELETEIGTSYLESAKNGFSPKLSVVFPAKPESEEVEHEIMKNLNKLYTGSKGKRILGIFSPRPELKPEINPINTENIDKQYQVIDEQTQNKILTGHGVVSPLLFGVKTAGQLGTTQELETAFRIYQNTVIQPYQNVLQGVLDEILEASDNPNRIIIKPFEL